MSMRRYLVLILISVITLVTFFAAIQGYKTSMEKASHLFDTELVTVAETLLVTSNYLQKSLKEGATYPQEVVSVNMAYQLLLDGQIAIRTNNAPQYPIAITQTDKLDAFSEVNFLGQRWRTFVKVIPALAGEASKQIIVAQPIKRRFELAEQVILSAVTPIIVVIPLIGLLISMAIRQALKPLNHLTKELSEKKINDLSQLNSQSSSKELQPVVNTLNQLFERLSAAFERERHFASDAAHELRTPLSVLKINVHNLLTAQKSVDTSQADEQQLTLVQLEQSVDRMAHVVDQILTLNRTNPDQIDITMTELDLQALLQEVISDIYPDIVKQQHDISLESTAIQIIANQFALSTMLKNLLGNACKYTPSGGQIMVACYADADNTIITLEDSGPGIADSEYHRVFDRFYRVGGDGHKSSVIGCGLGLAIVKHIANLHNAKVELSRSTVLSGLKVTVIFPKIASQLSTVPIVELRDNHKSARDKSNDI